MQVVEISNVRVEKTDVLNRPAQIRANAKVISESGRLFWRKKSTHIREVFLDRFSTFWIFVDNGERVPRNINALWRSWQAKYGDIKG